MKKYRLVPVDDQGRYRVERRGRWWWYTVSTSYHTRESGRDLIKELVSVVTGDGVIYFDENGNELEPAEEIKQ